MIAEWINVILEAAILYILILEYFYDKEKDEVKKLKKTKTVRKTTTTPTETIVDEQVETTENKSD